MEAIFTVEQFSSSSKRQVEELSNELGRWSEITRTLHKGTVGPLEKDLRSCFAVTESLSLLLGTSVECIVVRGPERKIQGAACYYKEKNELKYLVSAPWNVWGRFRDATKASIEIPQRIKGVGTVAIWAVLEQCKKVSLAPYRNAEPFYKCLGFKEVNSFRLSQTIEGLEKLDPSRKPAYVLNEAADGGPFTVEQFRGETAQSKQLRKVLDGWIEDVVILSESRALPEVLDQSLVDCEMIVRSLSYRLNSSNVEYLVVRGLNERVQGVALKEVGSDRLEFLVRSPAKVWGSYQDAPELSQDVRAVVIWALLETNKRMQVTALKSSITFYERLGFTVKQVEGGLLPSPARDFVLIREGLDPDKKPAYVWKGLQDNS